MATKPRKTRAGARSSASTVACRYVVPSVSTTSAFAFFANNEAARKKALLVFGKSTKALQKPRKKRA